MIDHLTSTDGVKPKGAKTTKAKANKQNTQTTNVWKQEYISTYVVGAEAPGHTQKDLPATYSEASVTSIESKQDQVTKPPIVNKKAVCFVMPIILAVIVIDTHQLIKENSDCKK